MKKNLDREPKNLHDPNAIAITLCGIWHMGYIPKDWAFKLATLMDAGKIIDAEFVCRNELPTEKLIGLTVRIVETT